MPAPSGSVYVPAASEVTFGGERHLLRCLKLSDARKLIAFFQSHSEETVRLRYGYFIKEMTLERAQSLVGVDQTRDLALGVLSRSSPRTWQIDAVGRYFLLGDQASAEVAFVVRESKRRLGIARALYEALADTAVRRGLTRLVAQVEPQNHGMITLFQSQGGIVRSSVPGESLEMIMPLPVPPSVAEAPNRSSPPLSRRRNKPAA